MVEPACRRDASMSCSALGLNTFEETQSLQYPKDDIMNSVARGAIYKNWNGGLRNPQAKKLATDVFNSGCQSLETCVPTDGFVCPGATARGSPELTAAYDFLNAPLLADGYEFHPPEYMMGVKDTGPNSVDGWKRVNNGHKAWTQRPHTANPENCTR